MTTDLFAALSQWDGKSASAITAIYDRFCAKEGFVDDLIELIANRDVEVGASWLLKHHCEKQEVKLSGPRSAKYHSSFAGLSHWEARLHVLQCMEMIPVPASQKTEIHAFLTRCVGSDAKFVRAWAYNGMARLAVLFPELRAQTHETLITAHETENAGSIRVRIRKALQLLDQKR